jgi:LacI family transcriptional regulator
VRIAALRKRAAGARQSVEVRVMEVGNNPAAYAQRLGEALSAPRDPIAVIVSNSSVASRTLHVLRTMGTDYPSRISLLAFEEPDWAELISPRLSVIRQPVQAIARGAWELLLRRMQGEHSPVQHLELRAEICLRESVRRVPFGK